MQGFYNITDKIRYQLSQDPFVKTITYGDPYRIDLKKQTIFPLSHVVVNNATLEGDVWRYNLSVMAMDIVDISKEEITDTFRGNDNEQDVLNTQLAVLNRLLEVLRRGDIRTELYHLDGNPVCEPFTERFENYLAGWVATFDVLIPNDMTACDYTASPSPVCDPASYIITDSLGNTLYSGTILSGGSLSQIIQNVSVSNSDASYTASVLAEGSLALPDITVTDSDGSTFNSPSVKNITCTPSPNTTIEVNGTPEGTFAAGSTIDIQLSDSGGVVTPDSVTVVGSDVQIVLPEAVAPTPVGATIMKTGQTTSYRTGDDGDLEAGRATSLLVLPTNNPFGNTNRFTDELGGSTYANNIVIDWSTYQGNTVLGYRRTTNGVQINWNDAIDGALALSIGSFSSGWRLPNRKELKNLWNGESSLGFNYSPINLNTPGFFLWTSNSLIAASTFAWYASTTYGTENYQTKTTTTNCYYIPVRTFTVTGTTLS